MSTDSAEILCERRYRRSLFGAAIKPRTKTPAPPRDLALGKSVLLTLPKPWIVHDQGERGACVAHAAIACLEYYSFKTGQTLTDYSEQFLHYQMRTKQEAAGNFSDRTWLAEAVTVLAEDGICLQSECQYDPFIGPLGLNGAPPTQEAWQSARARRFKAAVLDHPEADGINPAEFVLGTLRAGFAAAISIPVQVLPATDGVTNWTRRLGRYYGMVSDPDGDMPQGHAVCIVGYIRDAAVPGGGWMVFRNSWGVEWASEAGDPQPFAVAGLPARGYGVMSVGYLDTYCSEIFTITGPA